MNVAVGLTFICITSTDVTEMQRCKLKAGHNKVVQYPNSVDTSIFYSTDSQFFSGLNNWNSLGGEQTKHCT